MNRNVLTIEECNYIFKNNINLIQASMELISLSRTLKYDNLLEKGSILYDKIILAVQSFIDNQTFFNNEQLIINSSFLSDMLTGIHNSYLCNDYVLLADLYEVQVIPLLKDIQNVLINNIDIYSSPIYLDPNLLHLKQQNITLYQMLLIHTYDKNKYRLEYSDTGLITLSIIMDNMPYYLTTLQDPIYDAKRLAEYYYNDKITHYIIYGFGMGYHLIEMAKKYTNTIIEIFESDLSVIKIAFQYADFTELLTNSNINIHYDPEFKKLSKMLNRLESKNMHNCFLIHYPSIFNIKLPSIKNWMEDIFAKDNTTRNEIPKLVRNFKSNILHYDGTVDMLKEKFYNKTLFLVAAGPSLDKNVKLLEKMNRNNCIILALGTVFRKLLNLNIIPDYFIVSDPNQSVYRQIAGIEDCQIPMLYLSTALKDFALNYKGMKYIICQNEFDLAEDFAIKMGFSLYNTGGSVITIALDVGIQLGCKKIVFLGLDLAYTDGYAHASDTSKRKMDFLNSMIQVKSIDNTMIPASRSFIWFRKFIEEKIHITSNITFIDATEGGAYIDGTVVKNLEDVVQML